MSKVRRVKKKAYENRVSTSMECPGHPLELSVLFFQLQPAGTSALLFLTAFSFSLFARFIQCTDGWIIVSINHVFLYVTTQ